LRKMHPRPCKYLKWALMMLAGPYTGKIRRRLRYKRCRASFEEICLQLMEIFGVLKDGKKIQIFKSLLSCIETGI
jgi:hypothetical protein